MKLENLKIKNFRGILEFEINPEGDNVAIVGPNGSGKSTIVDAVDFLLTGDVKRLSGEGTRDIHLREHYPHIESNFEEARIEGTFSFDSDQKITVKRELHNRSELITSDDIPDEFNRFIQAAKNGQHFLSRREILKFITAKKGDRAEEIRSLMDIKNIGKIRKELKGARNKIENELEQFRREVDNHWERLDDLFENKVESKDDLLLEVNRIREELGGGKLSKLETEENFQYNVEKPVDTASASPLQSRSTKNILQIIDDWIHDISGEFLKSYEKLREFVFKIKEEERALKDFNTLGLIEKGKDLIEEYPDECPLCLKEWDSEELKELLEKREEKAEKVKEKKEEIDKLKEEILNIVTETRIASNSLLDILNQEEDFETDYLQNFYEKLEELEEDFKGEIIENLPLESLTIEEIDEYINPKEVAQNIGEKKKRADELPELDEIQENWDLLEQSYRDFKQLEKAIDNKKETDLIYNEMKKVYDNFIDARDEILQETYDAVADKFEEYYKEIHEDEEEFSPEIKPTEAGLDMRVGFHDGDKHPPHALHSEGHQDSMGLCLYLALCDHFESENLPLIMLDDVIMSIDSQHRRPLAKMLKKEVSPDYQLIITTHDDLWFNHLKTEGVVKRKNSIKFTGWSIEEGPIRPIRLESGWDRMEELIEKGDLHGAAHRLRRTAEWFLKEICERLGAEVKFKTNGRWSLGDLLHPALSRYKELLKKAKKAEQSWGNDIDHLNQIDDKRKEVSDEINSLTREINPNVHYNADWSSYTIDDFKAVADAYRELYELLWCENCGTFVKAIEKNHEIVSLKCKCGEKANWNLEEKES